MKKFPFKSTLLSDLRVLNPRREPTTLNDFPNIIVRLAQHFPQLRIGNKLDALRTEALDFQMTNLVMWILMSSGLQSTTFTLLIPTSLSTAPFLCSYVHF